MPAWSLKTSSSGTNDWFLDQLAVARLVLPDAGFDTIIGEDFAGTITMNTADVVGTADASPSQDFTAGVVTVDVGDPVIALNQLRLQFSALPTSHVRDLSLTPWFMSALVKITQPLDVPQLSATRADAVALWGDADNWIALGIFGNASGGSNTKWVGTANKAAGQTTTFGPNLDPVEGPVWHLFQAWIDVAGDLHFAIDGTEFAGTIDAAQVPTTPGTLSPTVQRSDVGDPAIVNYDKIAVFVASPTAGAP